MDTQTLRNKLEEEKLLLERELESVGRKNPENSNDWEPTEDDSNLDPAEEGDVAESMENFETNTAILADLETRLEEVNNALQKMDNHGYGFCEVCNKPIEEDRLHANPAARTCKLHMND